MRTSPVPVLVAMAVRAGGTADECRSAGVDRNRLGLRAAGAKRGKQDKITDRSHTAEEVQGSLSNVASRDYCE